MSVRSGLWDSVIIKLLYHSDITKPSPISPFQNFHPLQKGAFSPFFLPASSMRLRAAVKQSLSQITYT